MNDKTWNNYLTWRDQQGYTGISTQEQYEEFTNSCSEEDNEKLTKQEVNELEIIFQDVLATPKEQKTFDSIKDKLTHGLTISYHEIAELAGTSEKTARNHIKALAHKGYLQIKRGQKTNTYYWGTDMKTQEQVRIYPVAFTQWNEFFEEVQERLGLIEIDTRSIAIHTKFDYVEVSEQMRLQVNESIKSFWFSGNELSEEAYKEYDQANYNLMLTIYKSFEEATNEALTK